MKKPKTVLVGAGVLVVATLWLWNLDPERRFGCFANEYAGNAGTRAFLGPAMKRYLAQRGDGWLPRGGATPAASLTPIYALTGTSSVMHFTCDAMRYDLHTYFRKHGVLGETFMCYRYNEGLRADDPQDLIVMYHHEPTRWEDDTTKRDVVGRAVMTLDLASQWVFMPEAEFRERQERTLAYMRENGRR